MLKTKFQSTANEIDNQRPFEVGVTISAHESDSWTNCAEFVQNPFCANVSEVPDFICTFRHLANVFRQTIVRISQNENPRRRSSLPCFCHSRRDTDQMTTAKNVAGELAWTLASVWCGRCTSDIADQHVCGSRMTMSVCALTNV